MTSRPRRGFGPAGPPRTLQADTPVTWVTKGNQQSWLPSNLEWEAPLRKHRSLVLHSVAEQNGVSMFRKGGHRPRSARAFLRSSVFVRHRDIKKNRHNHHTHKRHTTHTKEGTPVVPWGTKTTQLPLPSPLPSRAFTAAAPTWRRRGARAAPPRQTPAAAASRRASRAAVAVGATVDLQTQKAKRERAPRCGGIRTSAAHTQLSA